MERYDSFMNVKILKNKEYHNGKLLTENLLLETSETPSEFDDIVKVNYFLYDLEKNIRYEMLPRVVKYKLGEIINVSISSTYIYFFNVEVHAQDAEHSIRILRYNYMTEKMEEVLAFHDDIELFSGTKQLKVFALNDTYLLVQHEFIRQNLSETYAGYFDFEIDLYNCKDGSKQRVVDDNLVRNGISDMIAISENLCVAKTGFSLLEDQRHKQLTEDEVSLEKISFINMGQLVSDMLISKNDIVIDTFEQAFFKNTIPYIKKIGDYIIYSKVDIQNMEEEVTFYNYVTKETRNCINRNVEQISDLANPCVIKEEPYIYIEQEHELIFLNLNTSKIEFKFQDCQSFFGICNDYIILKSKRKKGLLKKEKDCYEIYSYPNQELLLREYSTLLGFVGIKNKNRDDIYLFIP